MSYKEQDREFLLSITNDIARYANERGMKVEGMKVDDTIVKLAEWLLAMTKIAMFNNFKGDWTERKE